MASGGFYKMYRGWMDDPVFMDESYTRAQAFEWLISEAAWKPRKHFVKGTVIIIPRGSLVFTERQLAEQFKWGRQKIRTFLSHLEKDEKLTREITQGLTQLTICNYEKYQETEPTEQPANKPKSNPAATQQQPTTEEGKEIKEVKEVKNISPQTPQGDQFDQFWEAYPKKVGKGDAEKAWKAAIKIIKPDQIIDTVKAHGEHWRISKTETEFIPGPARWLRAKRWLDELETEKKFDVRAYMEELDRKEREDADP